MLPIDVILLFISVSAILALVPGPDNIFVMLQSAMHGRMAGFIVVLGLSSGLLFHTTAVALGVAVIFQTSQYAFAILKYIGALYLLYLAWQAFTASNASLSSSDIPAERYSKLFIRGLIMNITNPKVTIFFLAFFPQFVSPEYGSLIAQFYQLGLLMIIITIAIFGGIAFAAGFLGNWLRNSPAAQGWINKISGVVFVSLAVKLALSEK